MIEEDGLLCIEMAIAERRRLPLDEVRNMTHAELILWLAYYEKYKQPAV